VSGQTDLIQGTLDLPILRTITIEPMHGWAIALSVGVNLVLAQP
jgi:hypothetical protein